MKLGLYDAGGYDCNVYIQKVHFDCEEYVKVRAIIVHKQGQYIVEGPKQYKLYKNKIAHWRLIDGRRRV